MINSFRLRIALSSAFLSGIALFLFGASALWSIDHTKLDNLARILRSDAEREAGRPPKPGGWNNVERDFAAGLDLQDPTQLVLLVQNRQGETIYRSPHWPGVIQPELLHWPVLETNTGRNRQRRQDLVPNQAPLPDSDRPGLPPVVMSDTTSINGSEWHWGLATGEHSRVAVGVSSLTLDEDIHGVRSSFILALPMALLLIGLGSWRHSSRAMKPIEKLTATTRRVMSDGLNQHLSDKGEDREFAELIEVFNSMLQNLNKAHCELVVSHAAVDG